MPGSRPSDLARHVWVILQEALAGFGANGDLRQASSLAFYTTLALIPALLLLTFLLGLATGSSQSAHQWLEDYLTRMAPGQAERFLTDVTALTRHPGTTGVLNTLLLAWSITPLVSALRGIIRGIFKERETRSIWITKLLDLAAGMVTLTGLAAVAGAGVLLHFINASLLGTAVKPHSLGFVVPFTVTVALVMATLRMFGPKGLGLAHLAAGALTTASLWFLLRPAFTLFLTYDQTYGVAFGSFKSMFLIVIWIYVSMAILLLGVEVAAACHRGEAVAIKRLMEGKRIPGFHGGRRFLLEVPAGHVFFQEGEPGDEMYYMLSGSVSIRKGLGEIARIGPESFFGEMTFLLGQERSATAISSAPCQCVVIHARNFPLLMREFPDTAKVMLVEMASRLRDTSERANKTAPDENLEVQNV